MAVGPPGGARVHDPLVARHAPSRTDADAGCRDAARAGGPQDVPGGVPAGLEHLGGRVEREGTLPRGEGGGGPERRGRGGVRPAPAAGCDGHRVRLVPLLDVQGVRAAHGGDGGAAGGLQAPDGPESPVHRAGGPAVQVRARGRLSRGVGDDRRRVRALRVAGGRVARAALRPVGAGPRVRGHRGRRTAAPAAAARGARRGAGGAIDRPLGERRFQGVHGELRDRGAFVERDGAAAQRDGAGVSLRPLLQPPPGGAGGAGSGGRGGQDQPVAHQ